MSDVGGVPPGAGGPSEAEMRAYLERLRAAPVEEVLAELLSMLLSTVQVKLGRPDGRLLLDVLAAIGRSVEGRIDPGLAGQVASALAELRLAQVEAERQLGTAVGEGGAEATADADAAAGTDPPVPPPPSPPPSAPGGSPASRLWVPGS
jgi:hypothetical protein